MMKKMQKTLMFLFVLLSPLAHAQELFNYAEPASNMPARSLGIRLTNNILDEKHLGQITDQFLPELMWGAHKNLMLHLEGIANNSGTPFRLVGGSIYAKYRFYSKDEVHRHFRMAAFARAAYNKGHVHYQEIETNGMNTGAELGLIATQLIHKQALSASLSWEQIGNNGAGNDIHVGNAFRAINYSVSTGRLILPRKYTSYRQTNLNIMLEVLGQFQPEVGLHFVDIAPSVQFIFHSQTRLDIGFRQQMAGEMDRMAKRSVMIRIEHLLFSIL